MQITKMMLFSLQLTYQECNTLITNTTHKYYANFTSDEIIIKNVEIENFEELVDFYNCYNDYKEPGGSYINSLLLKNISVISGIDITNKIFVFIANEAININKVYLNLTMNEGNEHSKIVLFSAPVMHIRDSNFILLTNSSITQCSIENQDETQISLFENLAINVDVLKIGLLFNKNTEYEDTYVISKSEVEHYSGIESIKISKTEAVEKIFSLYCTQGNCYHQNANFAVFPKVYSYQLFSEERQLLLEQNYYKEAHEDTTIGEKKIDSFSDKELEYIVFNERFLTSSAIMNYKTNESFTDIEELISECSHLALKDNALVCDCYDKFSDSCYCTAKNMDAMCALCEDGFVLNEAGECEYEVTLADEKCTLNGNIVSCECSKGYEFDGVESCIKKGEHNYIYYYFGGAAILGAVVIIILVVARKLKEKDGRRLEYELK